MRFASYVERCQGRHHYSTSDRTFALGVYRPARQKWFESGIAPLFAINAAIPSERAFWPMLSASRVRYTAFLRHYFL
jgi:hypothetical protein